MQGPGSEGDELIPPVKAEVEKSSAEAQPLKTLELQQKEREAKEEEEERKKKAEKMLLKNREQCIHPIDDRREFVPTGNGPFGHRLGFSFLDGFTDTSQGIGRSLHRQFEEAQQGEKQLENVGQVTDAARVLNPRHFLFDSSHLCRNSC